MNVLRLRHKAIAVFKSVADAVRPLAELACADDDEKKVSLAAEVFRAVAESGSASTGEWIQKLIERDDNVFSRTAACGNRIPSSLKICVENELLTFKQLSLVNPECFVPDAAVGFFPMFGFGGMNLTYDRLVRFYAANGCGALAGGNAFLYRDGGFFRAHYEPVSLSDLKNYGEEKAEIVKNTENFIGGLPAFHTLLYGDRGTGKSTTVRAVAHDYRDRLKVIELQKTEIELLPRVLSELNGFRQKYIIFIDDLCFDENDSSADAFKTALEGSLYGSGSRKNALVYCTSNRRHLYKETESAMRNENDERQAELALFDRFGLVVTYITPDKGEFIDILKQILLSRGIKWRDEYAQIAELAALKKGGRSPRAAKQIADLIESEKRV